VQVRAAAAAAVVAGGVASALGGSLSSRDVAMNEVLLKQLTSCPNLPSLPAIAMQVLELAQKAEVDIAEIAAVISKDPALSGKILKTVNSSFYQRSEHVSTISHALVILGLQSVKTLVLGFSLVTNLTQNKSKGFKHLSYWKRSIYAATAARTIAAKANIVQQEEAFLAALLMDIGMLVMDQALGERYGDVHEKIKTHEELSAAERADLHGDHAEVGGWVAEQWKLPPLLSTPIAQHHNASAVQDPVLYKLTEVVALGGRCADVFVDERPAPAIAEVRARFAKLCNLTEADSDALLNEIGTRTKEVASLFEINLGAAADFEAVLKRASEALEEIMSRSQTQASQTQASQTQEPSVDLKPTAATDAQSGLANRAHLDRFLAGQFTEARTGAQPVSLLLLDVDQLKAVNDKHGAPAGDQVLQSLGKLLNSVARPQDLAARYGGEALCLVLPGTSKSLAATIAESVRRAIAAKPVPLPKTAVSITVSIGVATLEPNGPFREVGHLLKAVELALYAAKKSGRNCVRVFTLPPTPTPAPAPAPAKVA
jgi:diguanylate cyclase (GGDEF)-like protein